MPWEEKSAWTTGVVTVVTYAAYLTIILSRAGETPLIDAPYATTLLWTIGAAIVGIIVTHIVVGIVAGIASPNEVGKKDQRDKEINRFGEYIGQGPVVAGATLALFMSMAEVNHFWIANLLYLGFVVSAVLASVAKIVSYRKGFHPW